MTLYSVSADLAAAITSPARRITGQVLVDWDNDGFGTPTTLAAPWVGSTVLANAATTSVTLDFTNAPVGEWCFAAIGLACEQSTPLVAPTGWVLEQQNGEGGSSGSHLAILRRRKQAGDTTATFTWSTPCHAVGLPYCYSGLGDRPTESTVSADHTSGTGYASGTIVPTAANRWNTMLALYRGSSGGSGATAPTISSVTTWSTTNGTSTAQPVTVPAGALIVVTVGEGWNGFTYTVSSSPALTFTSRAAVQETNSGGQAAIFTAYAATAGTYTITIAGSSAGYRAGAIYVVTGHGEQTWGGATATAHGTGAKPSCPITTTRDNSLLIMVDGDANSQTATRTYRDAPTVEDDYYHYSTETSQYGWHKFADVAGTYTEGMTSPANQAYALCAVEVRGVAAASAATITAATGLTERGEGGTARPVVVDSLTASPTSPGTGVSVTASASLHAPVPFTAPTLLITARKIVSGVVDMGTAYDFSNVQSNYTVGTLTQNLSGSRSFATAGQYVIFVAWQEADGNWFFAGACNIAVGGGSAGSGTAPDATAYLTLELADSAGTVPAVAVNYQATSTIGSDHGQGAGMALVPNVVIQPLDDVSGKVVEVSTDGTLTGDVPEQVRVVEGSAARSLAVTFGKGTASMAPARYFSPVGSTSPLAAKEKRARPVRHAIGFATGSGIQYVPLFTGYTTNLPVAASDRSATLSAVDNAIRLRAAPNLPYVVADDGWQRRAGLNATWVVSYVLQRNQVYASPAPRSGCALWAPMHGSGQPFIHDDLTGLTAAGLGGVYATSYTYDYPLTFDTGPFVLAWTVPTSQPPGIVSGRCDPNATGLFVADTGVGRIECYVNRAASGESARVRVYDQPGNYEARLSLDASGHPTLFLKRPGGTATVTSSLTVPADGKWHSIGAWFNTGSGAVTTMVDSATASTTFTLASTGGTASTTWNFDVCCNTGAGIAEVQITPGGAQGDPWIGAAVPITTSAVIDTSTNDLDAIVPTDQQNSWDLLKDVAAAELAAVYWTNDGVFRYRTVAALVSPAAQTEQLTLTSTRNITELKVDVDVQRVRNYVRCPYSPVVMHSASPVWSSSNALRLEPARTTSLVVGLSGPAFGGSLRFTCAVNTAPDGTGTQLGNTGTGIANMKTSGTTVGRVTVSWSVIGPATVRIDLQSQYTHPLWLVDTQGQSALVLYGDWTESVQAAEAPVRQDTDSQATYGVQPLDMADNRWRQRRAVADGIALRVLNDTATPQPVITDLEIVGDPRLEYYDRVRVRDSYGLELDGTFWVRSITGKLTGNAFTQTIAATATRDALIWDSGAWDREVWT
ncbi:MAG TPA: hypothetical protein VF054_06620 [Micromonosporaceae bacterium]